MFKALFNIIINLVASLIQVVLWPLNQIIILAFPNISDTITGVSSSIAGMFDGIGWGLGLIPSTIKSTIILILGLEIAKHSVYVMSHLIIKVWNLIQKLKFW